MRTIVAIACLVAAGCGGGHVVPVPIPVPVPTPAPPQPDKRDISLHVREAGTERPLGGTVTFNDVTVGVNENITQDGIANCPTPVDVTVKRPGYIDNALRVEACGPIGLTVRLSAVPPPPAPTPPPQPVPVPTPTPAPTPTPPPAPVQSGRLDPRSVQVVNAPDFRDWAQTTALTTVEIRSDGVHVEFSKQDGPGRWPDVIPPGWAEGLQYSLGVCFRISGTWYCNAPIEFWYGLPAGGGPIQQPGQFPQNWFYDANRWGAMAGYQPKPGEQIAVFVVAGDARNNIVTVRERSDFVLLQMPSPGTTFTWTP